MKGITDLARISVSKIRLLILLTAIFLFSETPVIAGTASDLLGSISISGLDNLPVSNLQTTDSYKSADITVHGQTATLVVFKPAGADKNVVAVVPDNFSIGDFVPLPSGTPLDDVTFSDMAFIIAQANISLAKADAPTPLNAALSHGGDTVILKQGVNLFGEADFSASGSVKDLLSNVGITDLTLPLNGSLPSNLFSQDPKTAAQNFKNHILDNLDITLPLPTLAIPGLPDAVIFTKTQLAIKGNNDGGTRTINVDVTGEMDVQAAGKTVDFYYEVDVKKQPGQAAKITITGSTDPGKKITINMFQKFTLKELKLNMSKENGGWNVRIKAKSKFGSKPVSLAFVRPAPGLTALTDGSTYLDITTKLTLAEIIGQSNLPGLDDVEVNWIQVYSGYCRVNLIIKGLDAYVNIFRPTGKKQYLVGFGLGDVAPDKFIPGTGNSPLKDVSFKGMSFVYAPKALAGRLHRDQMPRDIGYWLGPQYVKGNIILKSGLNVFGSMDIQPTGELATLLGHVGVTNLTLPLNGEFSPKAFSKNISGTAIKNAILDHLDIKVPLPNISIPGLPDSVNIQHTNLTIKGKNVNGTRSIEVNLKGLLNVTVASKTLNFDFDVDVQKTAGQPAKISIHGAEAPGTSVTVNAFHPFTLTNLAFDMNKTDGKWAWKVDADSTFNSKSININYIHNADGSTYLDVKTKLTVADIVGQANLPGLDDIETSEIQVYDNYWRVILDFKGTYGYVNVFKPEGASKHLVAVTVGPDTISPAQFIPGTSNTPLKDVDFEGLAFVYAPQGTAGRLYRNQMPGDIGWRLRTEAVPGNIILKEGLNVFGKIKVHPTGEIASMLKKVGIIDLTLPLNGGFSPKAFSKDISGTAIKSAILANLDLHLSLPTPNIPGLDKALTFNNGKMHISGTLPDGSPGISVEVSGDAEVHFGSSDSFRFAVDVTYDRASGGAEKELKITGRTSKPWFNPFGMSWIKLTKLSVTFDEQIKNGETDWDVSVDAKSTIGHHSNMDVTVNVTEENGALTDASFTINGPLDLSEVSGLKDIPEVNDLSITSLTASRHGIDAKTTFNGKQTNFFAFEDNDKWVIALSQNNFTLTEIVPPLAATPLKDIVLSEAAIVVTQAQVNGVLSSFGPIARAAFDDIYQITATNALDPQISIAEGLNLIAAFEHSKSTGTMKGGMTKLGMSEERVIIMGDIGGIMGNSNPHVNLQVELSQHGRPHNMPKWMNFADSTEIIFSIYGSDVGDDPVVEIGIGVDINTKIHDDNLTFAAKVGLEFQEEAVEIKFVMDLKNGNLKDGGTTDHGLNCSLTNTPGHKAPPGPAGWHRPFGIPGLALYDVAMDIGVDEDGALQLGFAGGAKIGGDRFCIAANAAFLPEAEGAPQDIAFVGAADLIKSDFLENLAIQVATDLAKGNSTTAGIVSKFPISDITTVMEGMPQPEYKNVKFAFVTPGASDPDLHIQGEGVALKGELYWLGKTLGSIDMAVGPTTGIKIDGTIGEPKPDGTAGDLTIGPISFTNTYLDFQIPIPPKNPLDGYFKLNANLTIPVVGITEKINADMTNKGMSFSVTNTILSDFSETLTLALTGVDLSVTHPDVSNADFAISGSLQADFGTFIKTSLTNTMNALFAELNQTLLDGEAAVKTARANVDSLNTKINHERAIVRAERAKVEAKLETAQARVDDIQADINHDWSKYHHCSHWHFWCKPRWAITIGVEKGIKDVADLVLEAIEDLISHVPIDFDPRVWTLIASKDAAVTVLDVALASIEGLDDLDTYATRGLNAIGNYAGGSVNLKHASFNGDLGDIIASDAPVDLNIDLELFGADFNETFAFKLGDAKNELKNLGKKGAKDSAHLAILAYVAADHLFNKVLSDIPEPFKRQLQRSIGEKIHTTQTALQAELKKYNKDFLKYHKTAQALQVDYSNFSDSYSTALMQKRVTRLDKEPASQTFTDAQLELGATGLCLTNNDGDMFNGCAAKDDEGDEGSNVSYSAQKILTEKVLYTSGKKKGKPTGYVKIKGASDSCLTIPGKWKFEEVTYDNTIVEQEVFKPYTFYGDTYGHGDPQPYGLPIFSDRSRCKDELQFQWKILAHGADYFQIHNRATQTCIWMKSTNDGYGDYSNSMEMIPCAGANTSVFRIAKAIPAVFHSVGLPIKRGYGLPPAEREYDENKQGPAPLQCIGITNYSYSEATAGWLSCDKAYTSNSQTNEWTAGYDTFDYFEDNLGRRRYVSKQAPGNCLYIDNYSENGKFKYNNCDSEDESQWMLATQVVGGLSLSTPGDGLQYSKLTLGDKFPDPRIIFYQPLNPKAGAEWFGQDDNMSGESKKLDVAYTGPEQTSSAINARATAWTAIKTGLAAKSTDLAAGKQACVESGKKNYCYRLGPQTGYVAKTVPTGQTPTQLTDGAPIITDDVSDALAHKLANLTPIKEPKWFICTAEIYVENNGSYMFFPGVVVNQAQCIFSHGKTKSPGYSAKNIIKGGTDIFWQPAGNGYLPSSPVITGRLNLNTATGAIGTINRTTAQLLGSDMAAYSCRAMVDRKTIIGWTVGGKYCHITTFAAGAVVKNFEVLTVNGSITAPPPPPPSPPPKCTYQMVENYLNGWGEPHCTPDQYNREHPDCHFYSRANGMCDGGPPDNDGGL